MATDPIFAAIDARRLAYAAYMAAIEADAAEDVVDALDVKECCATIKALRTTVTTLPGLIAFCEFGAELSRESQGGSGGGLANWTPAVPSACRATPLSKSCFSKLLNAPRDCCGRRRNEMPKRHNFIRATTVMPALAMAPASALAVDPSVVAIDAYREAHRIFADAPDDDALETASEAESLAAIAALTTVPTTAAGLRAFCEFGAWLLSVGEAELHDWTPGDPNCDAERMYLTTLATAARHLLPA